MTKTLTEQWREGTLQDGYYYIDYDTQQRIFEIEDGCATYQGLPAETYFLNDICLIKVLAPVPSYDEFKQLVSNSDELVQKIHILEKRLEIALEVFGIIAMHSKDPVDAVQAASAISQIKEMEGVK